MTLTSRPIAVSVSTAAQMLDCSTDVLRAAIRSHQDGHPGLVARKIGSRWSIRIADLEAWYARQGGAS